MRRHMYWILNLADECLELFSYSSASEFQNHRKVGKDQPVELKLGASSLRLELATMLE